MTKNLKTNDDSGARKPVKRSILGLLFNPQLGPAISPLRESTRIFLQLLANVFVIYKLLPKTYPGLRDDTAKLSLSNIIGTAWQNLQFTREGVPQIIIFFAITGVMIFTGLIAIAALLSLFVGRAHADTGAAGGSMFQPETQDIADAWLQYLFQGTALPNYYDQMGQAIPQSAAIQTAFTSMLAFYSDAILIVAAIILFYHLASMVVETAHHGQVMGKRANQIWAPIRLVVAIGLLVPISGGLSAGQFIVVKVASLGSNLASHTWDQFLSALATPKPVAPQAPNVAQIAADLITDEACVYDFNARMDALTGLDMSNAKINAPIQSSITIDGHPGTKYSFSSNDLKGKDICGWYFIPSAPSGADAITTEAYKAQSSALTSSISQFATAGKEIQSVMPYLGYAGATPTQPITLDVKGLDAIVSYQAAVAKNIANINVSAQAQQAQSATQSIQPYGWVFAGTFLNTIERIQAGVSNAVTAGMPQTGLPNFNPGGLSSFFQSAEVDQWKGVAQDIQNFNVMESKAWAQQNASNTQCAAMLGLNSSAKNNWGAGVANIVFGVIDQVATWTGVWGAQSATQACGGGQAGLNTFRVGIQLNSSDPISQMAALGHANLDAAFTLLSLALAGKALGVLGGMVAGAAATAAAGAAAGSVVPGAGTVAGGAGGLVVGAVAGTMLGALGNAAAGVLELFATIFFACGFTLAYILPLFAFTRFFFAVLSWVGAIVEAVIAIPLVALAHLNPEGDGLPGGSAKAAYFYVFNIFLRPVLCVFGLIAGLMIFYIAVSLLTYTFNLAVAGSGGTAYGHEAMSRLIYSVIYVAMMYICANHSFAMIDHVPEQALKWMGASGQSMPRLGEAGHMSQAEGLIASYAGQQMMGGLTRTGDALGKGVQDSYSAGKNTQDAFDSKKEKLEAGEEAKKRHGDMMGLLGGIGGGAGKVGGPSGQAAPNQASTTDTKADEAKASATRAEMKADMAFSEAANKYQDKMSDAMDGPSAKYDNYQEAMNKALGDDPGGTKT